MTYISSHDRYSSTFNRASMTNDIGLVFGTGLFMVFGLLIAFVLPKVFAKDEGLSEENLRMLRWVKWLGLTLVFMSLLAMFAFLFLP